MAVALWSGMLATTYFSTRDHARDVRFYLSSCDKLEFKFYSLFCGIVIESFVEIERKCILTGNLLANGIMEG